MEASLIFKGRRSSAAVSRVLARPDRAPEAALRWRYQGIGDRAPREIAPEVDQQQAIRTLIGKETEQESFITQHAAVDFHSPLVREGAVAASERQEIAVQRDGC